MLRLIVAADEALDRPEALPVVDIGAGGAHLLCRISEQAPAYLSDRLRPVAVELGPPPTDLPDRIAWTKEFPPPGSLVGVVLATEWLDNVPLDVAVTDAGGELHYALVSPASGEEVTGPPLTIADANWARRWWPVPEQGWPPNGRVELGLTRDDAWAAAVATLAAGLAVTVDYGHVRSGRPLSTLTGYYAGRSTPAVPNGATDITAHVAIDACRAAGEAIAGQGALLLTQREALRQLGVDGARPPIELAHRDPHAYVRRLAAATQAAELTDPSGLGAHFWIVQPVGIPGGAIPLAADT
jgi:SAM-dependent MidA family methyltransferase